MKSEQGESRDPVPEAKRELQRDEHVESLALKLRSTIRKIRSTIKAPGSGARCW